MIKLNSLNGWQRLFAAFLAFIYIPIVIAVIGDKPHVAGLTNEQFLQHVPTDLLLEMQNKKAFFTDLNDKKPWDDYFTDDKFIRMSYDFAYSWRYILSVDKSVGESKATAMGEKLGQALTADYNKKLLLARGKNLAIFIFAAIAIYAFGWTIGWIYRGFKQNK